MPGHLKACGVLLQAHALKTSLKKIYILLHNNHREWYDTHQSQKQSFCRLVTVGVTVPVHRGIVMQLISGIQL